MAAERELADLYVGERLPAWLVRDALRAGAPAGIAVSQVHDVWLGAPPLAATLAAADYRVVLADSGDVGPTPTAVRDAVGRVLAAATIPRQRQRGTDSVTYDLRPLLRSIEVRETRPVVLSIRTLFHPERGAGRPEEVIAALGDALGVPLEAAETTRERVLTAEDLIDVTRVPEV
jgi:hypothetical protein